MTWKSDDDELASPELTDALATYAATLSWLECKKEQLRLAKRGAERTKRLREIRMRSRALGNEVQAFLERYTE